MADVATNSVLSTFCAEHVDRERRAAGVRERAGEPGQRAPERARDGAGLAASAARRAAMRSVKRNHWFSANVTAMSAEQQPDALTGSAPNASAPSGDADERAGKQDREVRARPLPAVRVDAEEIHRAEDRQHDAGSFVGRDEHRHQRHRDAARALAEGRLWRCP